MAGEQSKQIWHTQAVDSILKTLQSHPDTGLTNEEASKRISQYGTNELDERGGKSPFLILWEQFTSTMVLILIVAAVISGFLGKPLETIAISAIVVLFALLGFFQEYRAERAISALKQFSVPAIRVRRNRQIEQISATDLVPGDIVLLEAGSAVPADLRLIESNNLMIQEASLTGESEPVEKITDVLDAEDAPLGDRRNMAYMGTSATYGRGMGVVIATGMTTELGRIAELIQTVEQQETPLQRQLGQVGTLLAIAGVVIAAIVMAIGVFRGETLSDMFLTAVSVAVAIVPEGLPAVVTLTLALGAQRMLRRRALIRKLPAVETLGSVSVICSDKTGTLTENRMTVTILDVAGHFLELAGTSKHPAPDLVQNATKSPFTSQPDSIGLLLIGGALCNDASLQPDETTGKYLPIGDPTEGALLVAATQAGLEKSTIEAQYPRVAEVPFDSDRKRMTTVHALNHEQTDAPQVLNLPYDQPYVAFTKGSVDGLLDITDDVWVQNHVETLDTNWRERIQIAHDKMALNGMRVLGLAMKPIADKPDKISREFEQNLTFVGLVGMIDPPRPEVKAAIETCRQAGIRPIMITGDHPLTARFIANELGITDNNRVKTGQDIDRMSREELAEAVKEVSVYARVTPEHKLRIVEILQNQSNVVAMTGDGVNDSPALKKADIGIAMGITGTDVSKEAAQMVLLDDNFTTIVAAVEEGRAIFNNLRRFVRFSIAGNLGKVFVMLLAPMIGISVALLPLQLLWLNLLTDGLLGLGLGMERADIATMNQPPRSKDARFLDAPMQRYILIVGLLIGSIALVLGFIYFDPNSNDVTWQTMIFSSLAFMQIGQALTARSESVPIYKLGLQSNPVLIVLAGIVILLQLLVLYVPFMRTFFEIEALTVPQLLICVGLGIVMIILLDIPKWFKQRERKFALSS